MGSEAFIRVSGEVTKREREQKARRAERPKGGCGYLTYYKLVVVGGN